MKQGLWSSLIVLMVVCCAVLLTRAVVVFASHVLEMPQFVQAYDNYMMEQLPDETTCQYVLTYPYVYQDHKTYYSAMTQWNDPTFVPPEVVLVGGSTNRGILNNSAVMERYGTRIMPLTFSGISLRHIRMVIDYIDAHVTSATYPTIGITFTGPLLIDWNGTRDDSVRQKWGEYGRWDIVDTPDGQLALVDKSSSLSFDFHQQRVAHFVNRYLLRAFDPQPTTMEDFRRGMFYCNPDPINDESDLELADHLRTHLYGDNYPSPLQLDNLRHIIETVQAGGGEVILFNMPLPEFLQDEPFYKAYVESVEQITEEYDVRFEDLTDLLPVEYFADPFHYTYAGNALVREAILELLGFEQPN